ncbi:MAG: ABC transporter permease [Acidobacteria bacterium]|nr:ABC transporter permease [Acidobacteriota bacterium]
MPARGFEFFVALRYLVAPRKQAGVSVITVFSMLAVALGVIALIVAMAITNGFRNTLQDKLLGATPHVVVMEKEPSTGIEDWRELSKKFAALPGVKSAAPALYGPVMFTGPLQAAGGYVKGILPPDQAEVPEALRRLKSGAFKDWKEVNGYPPIILGWRLAQRTGMLAGSILRVMSPQGEMTPLGTKMVEYRFRVAGTFDSGFYDFDNQWAFTSLEAVQKVLSLPDVVNAVEMNIANIYTAGATAKQAEALAGPKLGATHWIEQNKQFLSALRMERVVTFIVIGMLLMIAALNIFTSLVMAVMEKQRDIAILIAMGATQPQVSRIFILQGVLIGIAGTAVGVLAGHLVCFLANRYRWIELDDAVYSISFIPFEPRAIDTLWIVAVALAISFFATIYPARAASRIAPAVALRYE